MNRKYLKKQDGFTLVEMIIALTLLLLVALSFIPMFVFISEASQNNRVQLIAQKLASSKIEEIRALPYEQVGTVGGNPEGVISPEYKEPIDGITFTVKTNIWWVDDPSDNDPGGNDPDPYDYKRVKVTVTSPKLFAGEEVKTADINTLVAREGEERVLNGGNLRVTVHRGWCELGELTEVVEGVKIDLVGEDGAILTGWTGDDGEILFAGLDEGSYIVKTDVGIRGMMVKPDEVKKEVNVVEGVTENCAITVEYPCYLEIKLVDRTGQPITAEGDLLLTTSDMVLPTIDFTTDGCGMISSETIGEVWPAFGDAYDVIVSVDGYFDYRLQKDLNQPWDGTFIQPEEKIKITIELTPSRDTASVTVTDANNGSPVVDATVYVYEHEYVYQNGSWVSSNCRPAASTITNTSGIATFALSDSLPKPDDPQDGDRYTSYCVHVSRDGYKDKEIHDAFWIIGGKQMSSEGEIGTYAVKLSLLPSIRVIVKNNNGTPANGVDVRIVGPGYDRTGETTNGEIVFEQLVEGEYTVSRRVRVLFVDRWETTTVNVVSGEIVVQFKKDWWEW